MMMKANLDVQMNMTFSSLDAFGAEVKMESRANKLLLKFHNEQIERHARQALNTLNSIKNVKGMCGVKKENIEKTINSTANLIEKSVEYSNIINN